MLVNLKLIVYIYIYIYIYIYTVYIYSRSKRKLAKIFLLHRHRPFDHRPFDRDKTASLSPTHYMTIYKSTNLQSVNIKTLKSSNRSNKFMFTTY